MFPAASLLDFISVACGEDSGDHWSPGSGLPDDLGSSVTSDDFEGVELIGPFREELLNSNGFLTIFKKICSVEATPCSSRRGSLDAFN